LPGGAPQQQQQQQRQQQELERQQQQPRAAVGFGLQPCGQCRTMCFLPGRLLRCCSCLDSRPMLPGDTYLVYRDGEGWVPRGRRNEGYCPACR
jgi:hypothetical protein